MNPFATLIEAEKHSILDRWLRGSTCFKDRVIREVLFENNDYIVLKHGAHADYVDRCTGVKNCESYAKLYLKSALEKELDRYGGLFAPCMREWHGRISRRAIQAECKEAGIVFHIEKALLSFS